MTLSLLPIPISYVTVKVLFLHRILVTAPFLLSFQPVKHPARRSSYTKAVPLLIAEETLLQITLVLTTSERVSVHTSFVIWGRKWPEPDNR